MKVTEENVGQLINKFMEGETSNAEEAALYKFFKEGAVPDKLRVYKPMFAYFAGGMKEEDLPGVTEEKRAPAVVVPLQGASPRPSWQHRWRRFVWPLAAGVAACFFGVTGFLHYEKQQDVYNSYSGSYVIEHGRRLSDIRSIMPRLQRVEAHADAADASHQTARVTQEVLGGIADPSVRAAAEEALR